MRRAGGWILGLLVAAAMAGGAWVGLRPILQRETLLVEVSRGDRGPTSDALRSGIQFALDEVGHRAGGFRIELLDGPSLGSSMGIDMNAQDLIAGDVSSHSNYRYIFPHGQGIQVLSPLRTQGTSAAAWAVETGARRMALLWNKSSPRSEAVATGFEEQARTLGIPVGVRLDADQDREELLNRTLEARPDFVFYAGEEAPYGRAFEIFDALRKRGYAGRLITGEADPEVSYLAVPTRIVDGTYLVSPIGLPSPEFAAAYEPATGRHAGPHAWPGYLTMKAVLQVIERASSRDSDALRQALQEVGPKPRPCALYLAREGKFAFLQDLK